MRSWFEPSSLGVLGSLRERLHLTQRCDMIVDWCIAVLVWTQAFRFIERTSTTKPPLRYNYDADHYKPRTHLVPCNWRLWNDVMDSLWKRRHYISLNCSLFLGCPAGWEFSNSRCYLFVTDNRLFFEEADADCWVRNVTSCNDLMVFQQLTGTGVELYCTKMRINKHKVTKDIWLCGERIKLPIFILYVSNV